MFAPYFSYNSDEGVSLCWTAEEAKAAAQLDASDGLRARWGHLVVQGESDEDGGDLRDVPEVPDDVEALRRQVEELQRQLAAAREHERDVAACLGAGHWSATGPAKEGLFHPDPPATVLATADRLRRAAALADPVTRPPAGWRVAQDPDGKWTLYLVHEGEDVADQAVAQLALTDHGCPDVWLVALDNQPAVAPMTAILSLWSAARGATPPAPVVPKGYRVEAVTFGDNGPEPCEPGTSRSFWRLYWEHRDELLCVMEASADDIAGPHLTTWHHKKVPLQAIEAFLCALRTGVKPNHEGS